MTPHVCKVIPGGSSASASTYVWQRLIGSPKLQIIFQKRANKYRALLLKMTYKDKGSYEYNRSDTTGVSVGGGAIYIYICIYIHRYTHILYIRTHIYI